MKKYIPLLIGLLLSVIVTANQEVKPKAEWVVKEFEVKKKNFLKENNIPDINQLNQQNAIVGKYSLDSLVHYSSTNGEWFLNEKEVSEYNEMGQAILQEVFVYDIAKKAWRNSVRRTMDYNEDGLTTMIKNESWFIGDNRWRVNYQLNFDYNSDGNLILEEAYADGFNEGKEQFMGLWKTTYEFDSNQHETLTVYYNWNNKEEKWVANLKTETLYDENYMQLIRADYFWSESDEKWVGTEKIETYPIPVFSYVSDNKIYSWDASADNWYEIQVISYEVIESDDDIKVVQLISNFNTETGKLEYEEKIVLQDFISDNFEHFNSKFASNFYYVWDSTAQEWVNHTKLFSSYNQDLMLIEQSVHTWNTQKNEWLLTAELNSILDENDLVIERIQTLYDVQKPVSSVSKKTKEEFVYDNESSLLSELYFYTLNMAKNQWVPTEKHSFQYDSNARLIHQFIYTLDAENDWMLFAYINKEYNADGSIALDERFNYDASTDTYIKTSVSESYLDDYGELILQSEGRFHEGINDFYWLFRYEKEFNKNRALVMESSITSYVETSSSGLDDKLIITDANKYETDFNEEGFRTFYHQWLYLDYSKEFVEMKKTEMNYFTGLPGAFKDEIYSFKNSVTGEWDLSEKRELSSNFGVTRNELVLPFQDNSSHEAEIYFNYMADEMLYYKWNFTKEKWVEYYKTKIFYSMNYPAAVNSTKNKELKIYPNPATDFVLFDIEGKATIRLYDIHGRKTHEEQAENQATINISDYVPGVYFYSIEKNNGEVKSGKVMKR